MTEPNWDHYRAALAVLEEGSLSGAARALGLTQPTIGRQIAALEGALGVALFTRSQSGLAPTEAAASLRPFAETMRASGAALRRAVAGAAEEMRGAVRITASEIVGVEVVPPILAELHMRHPGIAIELAASDRSQDLIQRDADIAVRMFAPKQEAVLTRRVGAVDLGLHATRDYLARRGTPESWADLRGHSLIGFDAETPFIRAMRRQLPLERSDLSWRSDSSVAQLAAIRAGFGIGVCHHALGRRDRSLAAVLPEAVRIALPVYLAMHEDLRAVARYRVVFDALAQGLALYCAEGDAARSR